MSVSRRTLLLAGLGLAATGCSSTMSKLSRRRPGPGWPQEINSPSSSSQVIAQVAPPAPAPTPIATSYIPTNNESALLKRLGSLPRSAWNARPTIQSRVNPINGVNRMTVHHEGYIPVYFTSMKKTEERISADQHDHMYVRGWADIGYHFIIDHAGRLWEARPLRYQGAAVKYHNEHNLHVMCLGNFMKQTPPSVQVQRLGKTLKLLAGTYSIPVDRIYTHRELMPNLCPGNNLQPYVDKMRTDGYL